MLKQYIINSEKIEVKQVSSSEVITSEFNSFKSDLLYFVKVNLTGFNSGSKVNRAILKIKNSGSIKDKEIEIIECSNAINVSMVLKNTYATTLASTAVNTIVKVDMDTGKYKNVDITKLVQNRLSSTNYDNYVMFAVRTNNNINGFQIEFNHELAIIYTNENEKNEFAQHKSFDLGFAGNLKVDLLDGKVTHECPNIATLLSKPTLSYPISIVQGNTLIQEELGNGINNFFTQIFVEDDNSKVTLTSSNGKTKEYHLVTSKTSTQISEEEELELSKMGIVKSNITNGVWYCNNDLTYLSKYEDVDTNSNTVQIIEIFDLQNNKYVYWYYTNDQRGYLREYSSFKEDKITFDYDSSLLLTKMSNNFNEELEFSYSTINSKTMLSKITNKTSKDTLNITYDTSSRISTMTYLFKGVDSNNYYYTQKVEFTYDSEGKIIEVKDNSSRNKASIVYDSEQVSEVRVENFDKATSIDKITFSYVAGKHTKVSDFRGKIYAYMFNSYGQCINIFDNNKRYLATSFECLDNGLSKNITEKSKVQFIERNLIFNNSFENEDIFSEYGWTLDSGDESSISKGSNGVSGEQCLKINKTTTTPIIISQLASIPPEIESKTITLDIDDLVLSGYVKCLFEDESIIGDSDVVIKVVVSCIDKGDQTFLWRPTRNIKEWEKFTIKGDIQGGSSVSKIQVFIELNGQNCTLLLDDFHLTSGKKQTRYNMVSNGYFDKFDTVNLPFNWVCTNLDEEDKLEYTLLDDSHPSYLGRYAMKFTKIALNTSFLSNKKKTISQAINIKGLKNDRLVFSAIGKGQFSNDATISVEVKFHYLNDEEESVEFKFLDNIEDWQLLTKEIVANNDYDQVTLTITSTAISDAYIDAIQLYKDSFGTHYSYNEMQKLESITSSDGSSMIIRYGDNNQVAEIITNNGEWFKFTYGTNKEVSSIKDHLGNSITYTYDSFRNCTSNTLITKDSKTITKQFTYDDQGMLCIEEIDELGNVKKYTYDNGSTTNKYGLLTSSMINESQLTYYGYNEALLPSSLQKLVGSTYHSNYFTYTNKRENSSVYNNMSNYKYTYDDFGKLLTIKINDELYCTNEYGNSTDDINHNVVTKETFADDTVMQYTYDQEDNMESKLLNNSLIAEFKYNERNLVAEVSDHLENQVYSFDYTSDGKMKKVVKEGKGTINYAYDNLGNLQKSSLNIDGLNKSYDFVHKNESCHKNLSYYYVKIAEKYNDDIVLPNNAGDSLFGASPKVNTTTYKSDSSFNEKVYTFNESSDYLWYDLSNFNSKKIKFVGGKEFDYEKWQTELDTSKVFYMWVKPIGTFKETKLFTFQKITDTESEMLSTVVITSNGKLVYKNLSSNTTLVTSSNTLTLNKWNFVGVHMNTLPVVGTTTTKEYVRLSLNGEDTSFVEMSEGISNINHLLVGLQDSATWNEYSSSSSEVTIVTTFTFDVGLVGFGNRFYLESLNDLYQTGLDIINRDVKNENDGITYYNTNGLSSFEIVSLNGSFESNKGLQPLIVEKSYNIFDEVENFVFDNTINRQVFKCFENNNKMSYVSFNSSFEESGTISLRFKYESNTKVKPLISLSNETSENILVFINASNEMKVKINDYEYSQYIPVEPNKWYEVILSMNSSSGLVFIKGNSTLSFSNNVNNIKDSIIRVGTDKDNTLSLNGYIEKLGVSKEYFTSSQIQTIINDNLDVVLRNEYDSIGRIISKNLFVNDLEFTQAYTYKSPDGLLKTSSLIKEETLIDGKKQEYIYDDYGNVTQKTIYSSTNTIEEQEIYTYDTLFRLTQEQHKTYTNGTISNELKKTYTYDTNGNRLISMETENGNVVKDYSYYYDTTHKDRLSYINEELDRETKVTISYDDSFYKPSKMIIDGVEKTLTWKGRDLLTLGDAKYTYNASGLRIRKEVDNVVTNYIYEGSKLVGLKVLEDEVETTLIFNYDNQNKLMGLSIDNKEYFYIKDILENIMGIIDQEGNVIVYYKYDAWGNLLEEDIKIDNSASKYNPYIYKGYMYDRESKFYYLKSRYYSPRIGRFISMDKVEYVNPKDVQGLNLYAYCNNNPVMYFDPSGRFGVYVNPFTEYLIKFMNNFSWKEYRDETKGKKSITLDSGKKVYYNVTSNTENNNKSILTIYNSYELSEREMEEFLSKLEEEKGYQGIEEDRVMNEWAWHKFAYSYGYQREKTASVDVYFNYADEGHGIFSWVMNNIDIYGFYKKTFNGVENLFKNLKFI